MPRAAPLELDAKSQFFRSRATTRSWFSARWLSINSSRPSSTNLQVLFFDGREALKAQPIFGKIQDGTAVFTAELTDHPLGLLSLLQPPICVHRGVGLPS